MHKQGSLHILPYETDLLESIADFIIESANSTNTLPNLTKVTLVVSDQGLAAPLREHLLNKANALDHNALLGPDVLNFEQWWKQYLPTKYNVCSAHEQQLILAQALLNYPGLLQQANVWTLADTLLSLFNELTLTRITLHNDLASFRTQLASWYKINNKDYLGLQHEAEIIHQLWHAWHTELAARKLIDPTQAKLIALKQSCELNQDAISEQLHFIDLDPIFKAEMEWLEQIQKLDNVHIWKNQQLINNISEQNLSEHASFLQACFTKNDSSMGQRAAKIKEQFPNSPIESRLSFFTALGSEHEAHAIEYQIRVWLSEGVESIAVITENRRIARRLRALLERADIHLQDEAGWAISTTRSAACIEALLECIEENFNHVPFLDLLKSPFIFEQDQLTDYKRSIYRFERDIIEHENIVGGLKQYLRVIKDRKTRLEEIWSTTTSSVSGIVDMLGKIDDASESLQKVRYGTHNLHFYLERLIETLDQLGITKNFQQDAAGEKILSLLHDMLASAKQVPFQVPWSGFRACLGHQLESQFFIPERSGSPVQLLTLKQARHRHYDAIILASCEQEFFPGDSQRNPFFNQSVRRELDLPTRDILNEKRLQLFVGSLLSPNKTLISYRSEEHGEAIKASPWILSIRDFHIMSYEDNLKNKSESKLENQLLHDHVGQVASHVINCDTKDLPDKVPATRAAMPSNLVPDSISASAYNILISCPYKFFASYTLALKPLEEISEALSKREYGELVHLCLHAFFKDLPDLPGPFSQAVTKENTQQAIHMLREIAKAVFAKELENSFLARGWLKNWDKVIPEFIKWQIKQEYNTQVLHTEKIYNVHTKNKFSYKGQIDRIDKEKNEDGIRIFDYKTGSIKSKRDIEAGEDVQLPFYALLAQMELKQEVNQVEYVKIEKDKVISKHALDHETLSDLVPKIEQRLSDMIASMHQGQELPAWESKSACQYCDMNTLCRVGSWELE